MSAAVALLVLKVVSPTTCDLKVVPSFSGCHPFFNTFPTLSMMIIRPVTVQTDVIMYKET